MATKTTANKTTANKTTANKTTNKVEDKKVTMKKVEKAPPVAKRPVGRPKKDETPVAKKKAPGRKRGEVRNPLVIAILAHLTESKSVNKGWVGVADLLKKVSKHISDEEALKCQMQRAWAWNDEPERERIKKGKAVKLMLVCISLIQSGKIEQQGSKADKEYRLAK